MRIKKLIFVIPELEISINHVYKLYHIPINLMLHLMSQMQQLCFIVSKSSEEEKIKLPTLPVLSKLASIQVLYQILFERIICCVLNFHLGLSN